MFCCALLCVHSIYLFNQPDGKERAGCFALFVFLLSRDGCVALPHDITGLQFLIVVFLIILTYFFLQSYGKTISFLF